MPSIPGQRKAGKHKNLPAQITGEETSLIPASIARHPERRAVWDFVVEDLKYRKLWSPTYTFIVSEIAETAQRLSACRRGLDEEGDVVEKTNKEGEVIGMMSNPRFAQMAVLQKSMFTLIEKVGMSPKDIVFLLQTDAVNPGDATAITVAEEKEKIVYFRD